MKKVFCSIVLLVSMILALSGCNNRTYYWNFEYDAERIKEIKIVEAQDEFNYVVVKEIDSECIHELYTEIKNLEMKRYGSNLSAPYGMCFLILFDNGEYDIIAKKESKHFKYCNGEITAYNSWLYCDKNQFNALMGKYS